MGEKEPVAHSAPGGMGEGILLRIVYPGDVRGVYNGAHTTHPGYVKEAPLCAPCLSLRVLPKSYPMSIQSFIQSSMGERSILRREESSTRHTFEVLRLRMSSHPRKSLWLSPEPLLPSPRRAVCVQP